MEQDQEDRDRVQEEDRDRVQEEDRDRAVAEDGWGDQQEDPAEIVYARHVVTKSRTRWANHAIA